MEKLVGRSLDYIGDVVTAIGERKGSTPGQGGGAPSGYAYALDNDNSIAVDADGARGMEAA
ncbi:hypothetical protein ASG25_17595 [Rhizobium sp. Leaf384]|uniref:hypothetical protein n=1 Tax=Rhizobium sp. Leaf384 TaxID=1736358 RepID=UPI0007156F3B|nr:hypothetical protein [Rhizobium sp. Leaf384]KQS77177.1 hypothetical protein ASG25_17595 [Rhizobium sp. Leaf384]